MNDWAQTRLESRIVETINTLIATGAIKNPKLSRFASVSDVSISKDKAYATLYVNCFDEKELSNSVKALQSASGFIQAKLGTILKTKNTPKLTFMVDDTARNADRIEQILDSLKNEQ